ncbi:MAG: hypothetical protein ACR652_03040 [Methylocystis sp.]|uniref:hypothetical protein n=1 Tax=Methylocystis sp. TaxID=1911079 RepID=UPI003DA676E4
MKRAPFGRALTERQEDDNTSLSHYVVAQGGRSSTSSLESSADQEDDTTDFHSFSTDAYHSLTDTEDAQFLTPMQSEGEELDGDHALEDSRSDADGEATKTKGTSSSARPRRDDGATALFGSPGSVPVAEVETGLVDASPSPSPLPAPEAKAHNEERNREGGSLASILGGVTHWLSSLFYQGDDDDTPIPYIPWGGDNNDTHSDAGISHNNANVSHNNASVSGNAGSRSPALTQLLDAMAQISPMDELMASATAFLRERGVDPGGFHDAVVMLVTLQMLDAASRRMDHQDFLSLLTIIVGDSIERLNDALAPYRSALSAGGHSLDRIAALAAVKLMTSDVDTTLDQCAAEAFDARDEADADTSSSVRGFPLSLLPRDMLEANVQFRVNLLVSQKADYDVPALAAVVGDMIANVMERVSRLPGLTDELLDAIILQEFDRAFNGDG